jgi:ketosteroid isomerase-like protein
MSSDKMELVQRMLGAYTTGDEETLRAVIGPEGEIHAPPGMINAGTYYGYDGFQQWTRQWEEAWGEVSYELREPTEIGDAFLVIPVRIVGRGAGSGLEIDSMFGWMYEIRDGEVLRFHAYGTADEAIDAAERLSRSS